jgi:hypothetical protein
MRMSCKALGIAILSLLAGCVTGGEPGAAAAGCDVSWIGGSSLSPQRACELRVLAKRCAVFDRCQIQCEARGGAPGIGGGCSHICEGGGAAQADDDMQRTEACMRLVSLLPATTSHGTPPNNSCKPNPLRGSA